MGLFSGGGVCPPIVQEIFAASICSLGYGVSSGQRLQQSSARTLLRQYSAVAAASNVYLLLTGVRV